MIAALYIAGVICIIIGFVYGIMSGAFGLFLLSLIGGIMSGIIFFALAKILENQEEIVDLEHMININSKKTVKTQKTICGKCNKKYEASLSSCPYCGSKNENVSF